MHHVSLSFYAYIHIYHISTWLFVFRVGRKNTRQILIELCGFVDQGVVICVWLPPPTSALQKPVLLSPQCFYICLESLCFSHSISLPPSIPLFMSLCISIFFSRCACVCLLCGGVCLIVTTKERLYKFKGTPGINVSSLSLSLYLSLSLSHCLSISLSSLSMCLSSDFETPRSKNLTVLE